MKKGATALAQGPEKRPIEDSEPNIYKDLGCDSPAERDIIELAKEHGERVKKFFEDKPPITIPSQLAGETVIKLKRHKNYTEDYSPKEYRTDSPEILKWLEKEGNYGVKLGNGLIVVSAQIPDAPTFTVKNPDGPYELYYRCPGITEDIELKLNGSPAGTIRASGTVAGPNCRINDLQGARAIDSHPVLGIWEIVNPAEIAEISLSGLREFLEVAGYTAEWPEVTKEPEAANGIEEVERLLAEWEGSILPKMKEVVIPDRVKNTPGVRLIRVGEDRSGVNSIIHDIKRTLSLVRDTIEPNRADIHNAMGLVDSLFRGGKKPPEELNKAYMGAHDHRADTGPLTSEELVFFEVFRKSICDMVLRKCSTGRLKVPKDPGWSGRKNYTPGDQVITKWCKAGGNYGIALGFGGLICLDEDVLGAFDEEKIFETIPRETLVNSTGKGRHFLYKVEEIDELKKTFGAHTSIKNKAGEPIGDLKIGGSGKTQIVGPGSLHPSGKRYEIAEDREPATVTVDQIKQLMNRPTAKEPVMNGSAAGAMPRVQGGIKVFKADGEEATILDVIEPLQEDTNDGTEVKASHPLHGSEHGNNLAVNVKENTWYCHRCKSGGGPLEWLAVEAGVVECGKTKPGWLKKLDRAGREKLLEHVKDRGFTSNLSLSGKVTGFTYGITYNDITKKAGKGEGQVISVSKAANAILEKMPIVMEEGDDDTIYWFDGDIYRPDGITEVDIVFSTVGGDQASNFALSEVMRRVKNYLKRNRRVTMNPYPYLLGVENGVVDLRTGELIESQPEFYITSKIPIVYDPAAKCPQFFKYLEGITPDVIDRLTLIDFGATLAIKKPMPFMLFLLGLGRNGKKVYENILRKLYGMEKFSAIRIDELNNSRFAIGDLKDKYGLIVTETGKNRGRNILDTQTLKKITGGDLLDSDRKNRSRIKFEAYCKPIIDTNIMPIIDDRSRGLEERFVKINLPYTFVYHPKKDKPEEKKKDPKMYDLTTTPEELQGILNVVVERAKEILKTEEIIRKDPEKSFEEYHDQSSSVTAFFDLFCDFDSSYVMCPFSNLDIYEFFDEWSSIKVAAKVGKKQFLNMLKKFCDMREPVRQATGGSKNRYYKGLTFDYEFFEQYMEKEKKRMEQKDYISEEESEYSRIWFDLAERFGNRDRSLIDEEVRTEELPKNEEPIEEENVDSIAAQNQEREKHFSEVAERVLAG